ncbi:MAG: M14 family zinc carboxypeptidase [Gemmatimonadaceae bacterium]
MRRYLASLLALVLLGASSAAAQRTPTDSLRDDRNFSFYAKGPYRSTVPRPESILGYAVGSWHTQYAQQERVLLGIAESARDRVRVEEIGVTNERRTMRVYVVSTPENIARLDAIRADLDRLADPRGATPAQLEAVQARTPAVVWFSGSVHGDEVPGFEASMQLLYHFAATEDPATVALMKDAIVIINPSSNPDGHERFSVWSNSIAVGSPERQSIEQQRGQPWTISGRFNHYRFDMNRDLMAMTQKEVQAIVGGMLRWHPMVAADLHGYTSTYYMAPAARPVNANISGWPYKWSEMIGRGNAAAFDAYGWLYNVRDGFDLYYPGYYDSWPALTGAMGTTYETDGGPALLKRREDGTLLSLRDGIAKHYTAAVSTWETSARNARELVKDYASFRQKAVTDGRNGTMKRVVFLPGSDPARAAELAAALLRAGVEVTRTTAAHTSAKARGYAADAVAAKSFPAGAYVVDLAQPQGKVAKAVLEPDPELDPVFAKNQLDRFARNQTRSRNANDAEGYEFYDISAWALPVAFGVEAYWTEDAPALSGTPLSLTNGAKHNGEVLPHALSGGIVEGMNASSSYLWKNNRDGAGKLAAHLLQEGYRVSIAAEPLQTGSTTWPRGTFIARVSRNDASMAARIDAIAKEAGVEVRGVNTAFPDAAQYGTGSGVVVSLNAPRVALVGETGISQTSYGAIWWTLEQRYGIKFTPISVDALSGDLSAFNVILIPSGGLGRLGKGEALKRWVEGGGALLTFGGATGWAMREDVGITSARRIQCEEKKDLKPAPAAKAPLDSVRATASPNACTDQIADLPGSHFDVVFDLSHWLTLGLEQQRQTVLVGGSAFYTLSKDGGNVAVFPTSGTLRRGGFVFPDNSERLLKGSTFIVQERVGGGNVVMFTSEPMFRGWWRALDRLVLNAMLLGTAF